MRCSDWISDVCSSDLDKVIKLIGYDASPADSRLYAHREGHVDPRYDYCYPLRDWGWDRHQCTARIKAEGLPVPVKSSCFFCAAMKPHEVQTLPAWCLRLIVLMEARAAPRLINVERSEEHTSELQSLMRISYAVL